MESHVVRTGAFGQVGRFTALDGGTYARDARVICRTDRGLEVGQVLAWSDQPDRRRRDGALLRGMTAEDELLWARIEKNKHAALEGCGRLLQAHNIPAALVDVELLFDGQSLFFYFLGEVPERMDGLTQQLAEAYETKVMFRQFAEAVTQGCGPGCGTEAAAGCGSACQDCSVAGLCGTRRGSAAQAR